MSSARKNDHGRAKLAKNLSAASRDAADAHASVGAVAKAQCPVTCHVRTGCVAPGGIVHAPFGPNSQPTKLAGSLIWAVVSPFNAGRLPPLDDCPVVCTFQ
jgi:hypothetical protein